MTAVTATLFTEQTGFLPLNPKSLSSWQTALHVPPLSLSPRLSSIHEHDFFHLAESGVHSLARLQVLTDKDAPTADDAAAPVSNALMLQ